MQSSYKLSFYKAHHLQSLRNVKMHSPSLIQIQSGSKRLYSQHSVTSLSASTYLLCRQGESLSFENVPLAGYFQSRVFSFLKAPKQELLAGGNHLDAQVVNRDKNLDVTLEAMSRYDLTSLSQAAQDQVLDVLYQQLSDLGVLHSLFSPQGLSYSAKVANYLAVAPHDVNSIEHTASLLGVSKATLIRKLGKEQIRYRDLLVEVRLNHALSLMQAGERELQVLAHNCGYASTTRFNQRFKERFGLGLKDYIHSLQA